MSFGGYLRDRIPELLLSLAALVFVVCMLALCQVSFDVMAFVAIVCLLCGASAFAIGYARRRRFAADLILLPGQLEHPWQLASIVEEPDLREQRVAHDALVAMGASAADEVERASQDMRAYREYIESWIHEVKAPIAAAELAAERLGGASADDVRSELARIEQYVEQALWYARSTDVTADYSIHEVGLLSLAQGVCKKNARLLIDRHITPVFEGLGDQTVFTDEKWASFIVTQAVVNAAKYGAQTIRFSAHENASAQVGAVTVLEVADDGRGIPAADVPRVFDRGFTGANGRAQGSSTGMGLYLAAVMCEKMGLGLEVVSEEGTGTRVLVSFPHDRGRLDVLRTQGCPG